VVDGQLLCAKATPLGPLTVAIADAAGVPVIVSGRAQAVVQADCAAINAIPVTPPAVAATVPVVAVASFDAARRVNFYCTADTVTL
jgi:hypothetical protein